MKIFLLKAIGWGMLVFAILLAITAAGAELSGATHVNTSALFSGSLVSLIFAVSFGMVLWAISMFKKPSKSRG